MASKLEEASSFRVLFSGALTYLVPCNRAKYSLTSKSSSDFWEALGSALSAVLVTLCWLSREIVSKMEGGGCTILALASAGRRPVSECARVTFWSPLCCSVTNENNKVSDEMRLISVSYPDNSIDVH